MVPCKCKVCSPIMVISVGNRQMEIDLKKDYQDGFKNDKKISSVYYFHNQNTLQKHN